LLLSWCYCTFYRWYIKGLQRPVIDSSIGDLLQGIIEWRCIAHVTDAEWHARDVHQIDAQKQPLDRRDALREMLRRYESPSKPAG
jgi:hypothetical protein